MSEEIQSAELDVTKANCPRHFTDGGLESCGPAQ
jgi:hypothetical protein